MITTLKPENYRKLFETLKKSGQTFQEVETKKRRYLVWNKVKYYNDPNAARLNKEDLGIMQAAKKEIIKNLKNINLPSNINRDYFIGLNKAYQYWYEYTEAAIFGDKAPHFEQHKKNIKFEGEAVQIDINAAYLTAGKNRKLLSEKT